MKIIQLPGRLLQRFAQVRRYDTLEKKIIYLVGEIIVVGSIAAMKLFRLKHSNWSYNVMVFFRFINFSKKLDVKIDNPLIAGKQISLRLDLRRNMHCSYYFSLMGADSEFLSTLAEGAKDLPLFVDIGANTGVITLCMAQLFPNKEIIAVEPVPENCQTIRENLEINGFKNVKVIEAAVSSSSGVNSFYLNPLNDGGGSMIRPSVYQTGSVIMQVPTNIPELKVKLVSLDQLVDKPAVVKIDVEGFEVDVIKSGEKCFSNGIVKLLVTEVLRDNWPEVKVYMKKMGYRERPSDPIDTDQFLREHPDHRFADATFVPGYAASSLSASAGNS